MRFGRRLHLAEARGRPQEASDGIVLNERRRTHIHALRLEDVQVLRHAEVIEPTMDKPRRRGQLGSIMGIVEGLGFVKSGECHGPAPAPRKQKEAEGKDPSDEV